jgi:hypothetical protein
MILQAESIQKFLKPCTHWIVINEDDVDIDYWHNALKKYYTNHQYRILTPKDFSIIPSNQQEWHSQQYYKLYISTVINEDYLILDTKSFFIRPTSLDEWNDTMGSGVLHKFGESIDGPPWVDISQYYAKKLNAEPITHFLFNVPFKVNNDIIKRYKIENLIHDLYPTREEEESYANIHGKKLYPSEFIFYSYLAKDNFEQFSPKNRSFVYVVPANLKNKNNNEIFAELILKIFTAQNKKEITSFAFHPLIFKSLNDAHLGYINSWLAKLNFTFQFNLNS